MITHHPDLSIRFSDCSPQLLTSPAALRFEYPQYIPHLKIDVSSLIRDRSLVGIIESPSRTNIQEVYLSPDARHCAVQLSSGHVLFYAFKDAQTRNADPLESADDLDDEQSILVTLTDLKKFHKDGFYPLCLLDARRGEVSSIAVSDSGTFVR